jgi:PAS domain S-box-containing protein
MADDTTLTEQLPDALIFADVDGVIRRWNPSAEPIFGHAAADAIGQRLDLIVPERFREAHWEAFGRAIGDAATKYEGQSLPTRAMRADGEQFYVELSFAIVTDADGAALGALATARDITERFEEERDRRRRLEQLEEIVASLDDGDEEE